jgi:predicted membrane metal-binding protein
MFYSAAAAVTGIFGLLVLLFGLRLLIKGSWFWGWLRGMSGVVLVLLAAAAGLIALDLRSYQQVLMDKSVATVSFQMVEPQAYIATVSLTDTGDTRDFYLRGDQWQMDARVIRWKSWFGRIGGKPGYKLDRLSGRYLSIEDERKRERTVHALRDEEEFGVDLWGWAYQHQGETAVIEAVYGSATFVPMADGALYEVALSHTGLVAKPLNDAAKKAINIWIQ